MLKVSQEHFNVNNNSVRTNVMRSSSPPPVGLHVDAYIMFMIHLYIFLSAFLNSHTDWYVAVSLVIDEHVSIMQEN